MTKRPIHITLFSAALLLAGFTGFGQKGAGSTNPNTVSCDIFIPNAFTPNGDNINERFTVTPGESCRMISYSMKVFDRWGRLVFETASTEAQYAWDGTMDGKELQKGVYMWNVQAKVANVSGNADTFLINRHGTVVLIR